LSSRAPVGVVPLLLCCLTISAGLARGAPAPRTHALSDGTPAGPTISSVPPVIYIGDNFLIEGSGFTGGSVVNFFVATSNGAINFGPFTPASVKVDSLVAFLPIWVSQGEGVASVEVVNTDQGHIASNAMLTYVQGDPTLGLPSLTGINGAGLSPTSIEPGVAVANVEAVLTPGTTVTLTGAGFDTVNGVGINLFCGCPGGSVGPFFVYAGTAGFSTNSVSFALPTEAAGGPTTGPGSFQVVNMGNFYASAAVSIPIGAQISVRAVTQSGSTVTVDGTGFSALTVINLFNLQSGTVVNLGGLNSTGSPNIALTVTSGTEMSFVLPAATVLGPAYVQALNPPFIPFSSSGNDPGGAFTVM
jgi:hypothetical protein